MIQLSEIKEPALINSNFVNANIMKYILKNRILTYHKNVIINDSKLFAKY